MKSVIDWNEIVPLLKKDLRETLMLEAVMLLSVTGASKGNGRARSRMAAATETKLDRQWLREGDGQKLSAPGRRYRVNKAALRQPQKGTTGAVWRKLVESKNDVIAYEGVASICKGHKVVTSTMICALWERGFIDVEKAAAVESKKVAVAY